MNIIKMTSTRKKKKGRKKYRGCLIRSTNSNTTSITEDVILEEEQKECKATPQ
jgi:hypothetical protein